MKAGHGSFVILCICYRAFVVNVIEAIQYKHMEICLFLWGRNLIVKQFKTKYTNESAEICELYLKLPFTIHNLAKSVEVFIFYAPRSNDRGHIAFVLSVCLFVWLSVVNFNLRYNFWTVRGRDFLFGMHTLLLMHFQMTPRSMTLWPWLWPLR